MPRRLVVKSRRLSNVPKRIRMYGNSLQFFFEYFRCSARITAKASRPLAFPDFIFATRRLSSSINAGSSSPYTTASNLFSTRNCSCGASFLNAFSIFSTTGDMSALYHKSTMLNKLAKISASDIEEIGCGGKKIAEAHSASAR